MHLMGPAAAKNGQENLNFFWGHLSMQSKIIEIFAFIGTSSHMQWQEATGQQA